MFSSHGLGVKALFPLAVICFVAGSFAASPGRPIVAGNTLWSPSGEKLRGGPLIIGRNLSTTINDWGKSTANLQRFISDAHCNLIRLCIVEPWYARGGYTTRTVDQTLAYIDAVVDNAETVGLYVMINYHDVGTYQMSGEWSLTNFWQKVAPRYKDRTHVLYEPANEPGAWDAGAYSNQLLTDLANVHVGTIRTVAPATPVVHLTFSQTGVDMLPVVRNYAAMAGINWADGKDIVAFHGYNPSSTNIKSLKDNFPCINTEWDYYVRNGVPNCSMDGELYHGQSMERLGIAWVDWHDWGVTPPSNLTALLIPDAQAKGYAWWNGTSSVLAPTITAATSPFVDSTRVTIATDTTGAQIRYTIDGSTPTASSTLYGGPLLISATTTVKALAVKTGMSNSSITSATFTRLSYRSPDNPANTTAGLTYSFYPGTFSVAPDVSTRTPTSTGIVSTITIPSGLPAQDNFALRIAGYISIPADGVYTFYISSDDGSKLIVGNTLVVDNDGAHNVQERSGQVALRSGLHAITVVYFEISGGESLGARWEGPGVNLGAIPANRLSTASLPSVVATGLPPTQLRKNHATTAIYAYDIAGRLRIGSAPGMGTRTATQPGIIVIENRTGRAVVRKLVFAAGGCGY